ncbi:MAG: GntR family transcriptional regulator [Victivallales bacterium]|nr:GntR family transcriptional regulator [Victivallales bacterium]
MAAKNGTVYSKLIGDLRLKIDNSEFTPGMLLPSENNLSDTYGISRPSVRKALTQLEQSGMIYRIPGKGSYVGSVDNGQNSRILNIGVDVGAESPAEWYNAKLLRGILRQCAKDNARMVFTDTQNFPAAEDNHFDGLIAMTDPGMNAGSELARNGKPVIVINRMPNDPALAYISVDYVREAERATEHLIAMGHKRIGIIYGASGEASTPRKIGIENAMRAAGIEFGEDAIFYSDRIYHLEKEICEYLSKNNFTAVFAVNATMMFQLYYACKTCGINIAKDISVMCFDDMELFSNQIGLGISYVKMPLENMGETAAEYIVSRLNNTKNEPIRKIVTADIVIKESCKII